MFLFLRFFKLILIQINVINFVYECFRLCTHNMNKKCSLQRSQIILTIILIIYFVMDNIAFLLVSVYNLNQIINFFIFSVLTVILVNVDQCCCVFVTAIIYLLALV